jgi:hypothetical protein
MKTAIKKILAPSMLERIEALEAEAWDYIEERAAAIKKDAPGIPIDAIKSQELVKGQYVLEAVKRLLKLATQERN